MQAVTRVSVEQASKMVMRKPTRLGDGEGRCYLVKSSDSNQQFRRGKDDGMCAEGS